METNLCRIEFLQQRLGAIIAADSRKKQSIGVDVVGQYLFLTELGWRRPGDNEARAKLTFEHQVRRRRYI